MKRDQSGIDVMSEAIRQKDEEIERLKEDDEERVKALDFLEHERNHALGRAAKAEQRLKELEEANRGLASGLAQTQGKLNETEREIARLREALSSEGEGE